MKQGAVVIGGGIVGSSIALRLQLAGWPTRLVDKGSNSSPSWGNAGHIAIEQVAPLASWATLRSAPRQLFAVGGPLDFRWRDIGTWLPWSLKFAAACGDARFARGKAALGGLMLEAMPAWERLVRDLRCPELLAQDGHYVFWEHPTQATARQQHYARQDFGLARQRTLGDAELDHFGALLRVRPAAGTHFNGSGQIRNLRALSAALNSSFTAAGGVLVRDAAVSVTATDGGAQVRLNARTLPPADLVVIAAGVSSAPLIEGLGHRAPLIAERGYHLHDAQADWPADLPPLVFADRGMIATGFRNGLRACSFTEFARQGSPADTRKWQRLHQHAQELGLPLGKAATTWMGARPTLPDYLPAIGRSRRCKNVVYAFGHQHLGLTLAPVTAEAVLRLISEPTAEQNLAAFDIERFGGR